MRRFNNEKVLARWEPQAFELGSGPPTSTFNPREIARPTSGSGTRIIGQKFVRSDYFNLASLMGPKGAKTI